MTEIKWVVPEELSQEELDSVFEARYSGGEKYLSLNTGLLFPNTYPWGKTGTTESKISESAFLCVTCSLKNVGKEEVRCNSESVYSNIRHDIPYGTIEAIYDDGYTFDAGEDIGFTITLGVLKDAITEVGILSLTNQVFENEDKPLKLKVTLPASNGEIEEFFVTIR